MGLRFHRSFQLFPGVRLNVSKSGLSASFGIPGATLNLGPRGLMSTVGAPGTGLSYRQLYGRAAPNNVAPPATPDALPAEPRQSPFANYYQPLPALREINSASVEDLTSPSLVELREMIAQAKTQKGEIEADLWEAQAEVQRQSDELEKKSKSIFRFLFKRRIAALEESLPVVEAEVARLDEWLASTNIAMQFETSAAAKRAYGSVVRAFEALRLCQKIWDVTSDRANNRYVQRTLASRGVLRAPVTLDYATSDLLQFDGQAMRFGNVNGEPIMIYPSMVMMPRQDGAFALVDLREVRLAYEQSSFHEEDGVPEDSELAGYTWAKCNKDGSPDRRFASNYQIPICLYGTLEFSSEGGILEEYQFSNAAAALEFGRIFHDYQSALSA